MENRQSFIVLIYMKIINLFKVDERIIPLLSLFSLEREYYHQQYNKSIVELYYDCHILRKYWNQIEYDDIKHLAKHHTFNQIYIFPIRYRLDNRFERIFFHLDKNGSIIHKSFAMWCVEDLINSIIDKININHNVFLAFPNH